MDLYSSSQYIVTPGACVLDITPPTFGGITSLSMNSNGSLVASWSAATDASTPVRYNVYIKKGTATGLFSVTPYITQGLSIKLYDDADGIRLAYGETYYVGVRAVDSIGNMETNTSSLSAVSTGVFAGEIRYECFASLAISPINELVGSLFLHGDGKAVKTSLGTASFKIYDEDDNEVISLTQNGLTANSDGVYLLTPTSASGLDPFTCYRVKIAIIHNSVTIESYVGLQRGE